MQELTAKATEIAEKMDLNEIDEIDSKLVKIQKNFKSYSNFKTFLLVIFVFIAGFLTSHGVDAFNSSYQESHKIVRSFENKGFVFSRTDKNQDVILTPVSPTTAFKLTDKKTPVELYLEDIFTIPANLAGIPGLVVPAGLDNGLPVGVQFLGKPFAEGELFKVGSAFEKVRGDWKLPKF